MSMVEKMTATASSGNGHGKRAAMNSSTQYKPAPAEIQYGNLRFLITDRPTDFTINQFIEELRKHEAKDVVRVCEPTYRTDVLKAQGISVFDWEFSDGSYPPPEILNKWINLVQERFKKEPGSCVAVHCVAGLGRAPVLVALALMEAGMKYEEAVEVIRQHRRGAINQKQLAFLEKYKAAGKLKGIKAGSNNGGKAKDCCIQ